MSKCTVVMYHFVRDFQLKENEGLKGLDVKLFEEQIHFLNRHYTFISTENLIDSINSDTSLPENAVLLTFDDGYSDHYKYVYPILNKMGVQGTFFVPAGTIEESVVLDVNKIHYLLASNVNEQELIDEILSSLDKHREDFALESNKYYLDKLSVANRFDPKEIIFIKRILQKELPGALRTTIINDLFSRYVTSDETSLCQELYMNLEQIREMANNGMHIGGHSYNHFWLGNLSKDAQQREIKRSMSFLQRAGVNMNYWTMCYPYGSYNSDTLSILKSHDCKMAFTTDVQLYDTKNHGHLEVPRLDTNDLPFNRNHAPNHWYTKLSHSKA